VKFYTPPNRLSNPIVTESQASKNLHSQLKEYITQVNDIMKGQFTIWYKINPSGQYKYIRFCHPHTPKEATFFSLK